MLNWDRIGGSTPPLLVPPRDIFAALPTKPWPYLRAEQGEALERWFARRNDRDVVIKQNTGGGKTVEGLLIAGRGRRGSPRSRPVRSPVALSLLTAISILRPPGRVWSSGTWTIAH